MRSVSTTEARVAIPTGSSSDPEGKSETYPNMRFPPGLGMQVKMRTARKATGSSIFMYIFSPAPDAVVQPLTTGMSRRANKTTGSRVLRKIYAAANIAYSERLMAITESCSATLTAAFARSSMCRAK